ncbi:hypothetical protein GCM10023322_24380 [Rugosimonospora acidiphila]|uniref:Uncharacterized protein n=1 Tax=Rugosimonospora acidiphila TaxID=556531 RepID=A0ABP9RR79_9ACTN
MVAVAAARIHQSFLGVALSAAATGYYSALLNTKPVRFVPAGDRDPPGAGNVAECVLLG